MTVHISDITDAMDMLQDMDDAAYYDTKKGEVVWPPMDFEDDYDEKIEAFEMNRHLVQLPTKRDFNDYDIMCEFIYTVHDEDAKQWLENAIHGRGAFRMFRSACERFGLLENWYSFLDARHEEIAMDWCEENGLLYDRRRPVTEEEEDAFDQDEFMHGPKDEVEFKETVEETVPIRIVEIHESNLMKTISLFDGYRREVEHENSDLDAAEQHVRNLLDHGYEVACASESGRFVGFRVMREGVITELFTVKDRRRDGIASALMKDAMNACEGVTVLVKPECVGALAFLKRFGYKDIYRYEMKRG